MGRSASFAQIALLSVAMLSQHIAYAAPSPAPTPTNKRALELFEQSALDYRDGRFQDAVDKLLEARTLQREPVLLYNLARAYEALGRLEESARAYEQYLAEDPSTSDRRAIEGRMHILNEHAAALAAARKSDAKDSPTWEQAKKGEAPAQAPRERAATTPLPWFVAGAGVIVVGTAVGLGAFARNKHDDAVGQPTQQRAVDLQESAETLARVATVMTITGAVLAVSGLVWGILRTTRSTSAGATARAARIGGLPSLMSWTFR